MGGTQGNLGMNTTSSSGRANSLDDEALGLDIPHSRYLCKELTSVVHSHRVETRIHQVLNVAPQTRSQPVVALGEGGLARSRTTGAPDVRRRVIRGHRGVFGRASWL